MEIEPERWDRKRVEEREAPQRCAPAGTSWRPPGLAPDGTAGRDDRADGQRAGHRPRLPERHAGRPASTAATTSAWRSSSPTTGRLRAAYPDCRLLLTGNADVNAPMNAVNDALGYREVERCVEMQKDV